MQISDWAGNGALPTRLRVVAALALVHMNVRRFAGRSRLAVILIAGILLSVTACTVDQFRQAKVVNDCHAPILVLFFPGGPAKPGEAHGSTPPGGLSGGPPVAPGASFPGYYDPVVDPPSFTLWVRSGPHGTWKEIVFPYGSLPKANGKGYSVIVRISGTQCP